MPLIDSPRLSYADREAWARWERLDGMLADRLADRLAHLAAAAVRVMAGFAAAGPCYVSVSWGKDSTVVAHLAAVSRLAAPLAYATSGDVPGRVANPDAPAVRDAFLAAYPHVDYREFGCGLGSLSRQVGTDRYISGVRGAESGLRRRAMQWHGKASARSCRPIGHWTHTELWAYLHLHRLPVHPAYGMSYGGVLDRSRIRVHSIGGEGGAIEGRLQWEDHYYPDVTAGLRGSTTARPA